VFGSDNRGVRAPSASIGGGPSIELDHVWENQRRQKASRLNRTTAAKASGESGAWSSAGKNLGRAAFESPSEGLGELFNHHGGPPPGVLADVGLPTRHWRWLGPWVIDHGDLKACDRRRADGSEVGLGGSEWFCADTWPAPGLAANSEAGSEAGIEAGYYPAREGTAKTTVRCRRWVRPRERRPQALAGRGAQVTSLAASGGSSGSGGENDEGGGGAEGEVLSPTEVALLAAADARRLNALLEEGVDSDDESVSDEADRSDDGWADAGALLAADSDEALDGGDNGGAPGSALAARESAALAEGGLKETRSPTESRPKESAGGLAGASWARSWRSRGDALAAAARSTAEAISLVTKRNGDGPVSGIAPAGVDDDAVPPGYDSWSFKDASANGAGEVALQEWDCAACAFRNQVPSGASRVCEMCETQDGNDAGAAAEAAAVAEAIEATSEADAAVAAAAAEPSLVVDFVWQNERWVPLRKGWVPSGSFALTLGTKKRPSFEPCRRPSDQGAGLARLFERHRGAPLHAQRETSPGLPLAPPAPATSATAKSSRLGLPARFTVSEHGE
jgi:hypothetical protein